MTLVSDGERSEQVQIIEGVVVVLVVTMRLFLEAPARLSPSRIVQILKSTSARELFREFPRLGRELWGGQLWSDGYFVRAVGDEVTGDVIRCQIEYHKHQQGGAIQLSLWDDL